MSDLQTRKLKVIKFDLGGNLFECQISDWKLNNNTPDGDKQYSYCPNGETKEETDPDWTLDLTYWSDWRSGGLSDYLQLNNNAVVDWQLDNHPDIPAEWTRHVGQLTIKRPSIGGAVRTTETESVTLPIIGEPLYTRP